jgi:hypothetical protein
LGDYPIQKAWDRVAKMLFPDHELVKTYARDRWLIDLYRPPDDLKHQSSRMSSGGTAYISGSTISGFGGGHKIFAPTKLIAEVDQAYFRESLRKKVNRWFPRHGFDLKRRTISKEDFEAARAKPTVTARTASPPVATPSTSSASIRSGDKA